jgi:hypothetical protein
MKTTEDIYAGWGGDASSATGIVISILGNDK